MPLHSVRALRLGRRLQALAGYVEQPAMERAAQPAVFQPAEGEIGAAMRAMPVDQAVAAFLVAKQHQVLAEQFYRPTGRGPCSSSTSAAGCQYIRISLPQGSLRPVRVIRSFASWLIMASGLRTVGFVRLLNLWAIFDVAGAVRQAHILDGSNDAEVETPGRRRTGRDRFHREPRRGLRVLELFGAEQQPMTLSDLARAADLPRATARRILFTFERAGFVESDGKLFR